MLSPTFTFLQNSPSCKSEKRCWIWRARVPSTFVIFQQQRKLRSKFFSRLRRLTERIENLLGVDFWFETPFSLKVVFSWSSCWCWGKGLYEKVKTADNELQTATVENLFTKGVCCVAEPFAAFIFLLFYNFSDFERQQRMCHCVQHQEKTTFHVEYFPSGIS